MSSYTFTENQTFTITHAKHIAAKVATDLKRMQRFYGYPSDADIITYESEIIELLKKGYLNTVKYGFKRNNSWIEPTLCYTAKELFETISNDDDPGSIVPGANIENASFYSYLTYTSAWASLLEEERTNFKKTLPFQRGGAPEPGITGYLLKDKTYSSGGKALDRSIVKNY